AGAIGGQFEPGGRSTEGILPVRHSPFPLLLVVHPALAPLSCIATCLLPYFKRIGAWIQVTAAGPRGACPAGRARPCRRRSRRVRTARRLRECVFQPVADECLQALPV